MADTIPLSSIPTVSDLYKSSDLQPASSSSQLFKPSSSLNSKLSLIRTSITNLEVTSIVNAANGSLLGGGGVDGAIHRAAGRSLLAECRTLGGCDTGSAKITSGHALPASYIIHAVGPVYASAKHNSPTLPAELLMSCYNTSLQLAAEKGGSVAFSCLSTGVYGYPSEEAADVALSVIREWLLKEEAEGGEGLDRVVVCCFEAKDERAYKKLIPEYFPPSTKDLPTSELPEENLSTDKPSTFALPLDTQASSLVAAAEKSANHEELGAKKLKVTNPDVESDEWETVEKPEDFNQTVNTAENDMANSEAAVSKSAGEADPAPVKEPPVDDQEKGAATGGNLGKDSLLKDW